MNFNLNRANQDLEFAHPEEILSWAWHTFRGDVAASSSFQPQSVPLLKMIGTVAPQMTVFFLDTGFHFAETLTFKDRLVAEWGLNVHSLTPIEGHAQFRQRYGELYQRDPDRCCVINKVEPMEQARLRFRAWISGIRRDQTLARRETPIVTRLSDGTYKICPLANWTREQVKHYAVQHSLPAHPLLAQGYTSIGCAPCTRAVGASEDERAGRWAGTTKTECGLHLGQVSQLAGG